MVAPFRNVTWPAGQRRVSGTAVYGRKETETIRNEIPPLNPVDSGTQATIGKSSPASGNLDTVITHHVDVSWNESWTGTAQKRIAHFEGNRVYLSTPPSLDPITGTTTVRTMTWEKLG
jgi:hypothetical protein